MNLHKNPLYKFFTPEDWHAKHVCDFLRAEYPGLMWWHTPNEGKRSNLQQLKVRDLGIRAGVTDILVISDLEISKGLCLELKSATGHVTDLQQKFMDDMIRCGWSAYTSYKLEQSETILKTWIDNFCSPAVRPQMRVRRSSISKLT
jgi:hypothetical protein